MYYGDNTPFKVVAIGDSITYGFPYTPHFSWVNLAGEKLGIPMINKGVNGDTTSNMLKRFKLDVLKYYPSHVVITGGTNDAFALADAASVISNIHRMAEFANENNITPIVGLPIPCSYNRNDQIVALYREELRQYFFDYGISLLDFSAVFYDSINNSLRVNLFTDGIHPNQDGYCKMADMVVAFFRQNLSLPQAKVCPKSIDF
ncbi:MAG TPA: GDSL-type esterase/lipase family protein [Methylomusa anaerophila]|uniref:Arylesterase n=1 Tax=Methylomusa anaerophila TaxID=1930071 RepID=A0A348ANU1_9FIRM|nr:GDSL-type esterase/lipase family protein [Methylomusa anaerophila]BBB92739.1 arylesterase precursor [Methylomusa anaerophila]HML87408.1 GDSL-type esterase/lipase family protein [Methylomusa anaerophila]